MAAPANLRGELTVTVNKAADLYDTETFGKQDPYVMVTIHGRLIRSRVHKNAGKNAQWDQTLGPWILEGKEDSIEIEVRNKNTVSDEDIGKIVIPLTEAVSHNGKDHWYNLERKKLLGKAKAGTLQLRINFRDPAAEAEAKRAAGEAAEAAALEEEARRVKEEAERAAKEEAEREAERLAKEEAERKAKEEAERKAKEEAEEAERKAREEKAAAVRPLEGLSLTQAMAEGKITVPAAPEYVTLPCGLQVATVGGYALSWNDRKSGARKSGSFWKINCPAGFAPLSHLVNRGHGQPGGPTVVVRVEDEEKEALTAAPASWAGLWSDRGSGAAMSCGIFRAKPPAGYVALSDACHTAVPTDVRCIRADLVDQCLWKDASDSSWDDRKSGAKKDASFWAVNNAVRGFFFSGNYSHPSAGLCKDIICAKPGTADAILNGTQ